MGKVNWVFWLWTVTVVGIAVALTAQITCQ